MTSASLVIGLRRVAALVSVRKPHSSTHLTEQSGCASGYLWVFVTRAGGHRLYEDRVECHVLRLGEEEDTPRLVV